MKKGRRKAKVNREENIKRKDNGNKKVKGEKQEENGRKMVAVSICRNTATEREALVDFGTRVLEPDPELQPLSFVLMNLEFQEKLKKSPFEVGERVWYFKAESCPKEESELL